MGITKRPTSSNSEKLPQVEFVELLDIVHNDEYSSDSDHYINDRDDYNDEPLVSNLQFDSGHQNDYHVLSVFDEDELREITEYLGSFPRWDTPIKSATKKKSVNVGMGRRKTNRAQNEKFLLSLGDTEQYNPKDEIFFNENKYGFTKVMNILCTQPEVKESFIEGNEDLLLKKKNKNKNFATGSKRNKLNRNRSPEIAFKNLTSSQKSLFKQKSLPFTIINELESKIVEYFSLTPNGIYTSAPLSNYHRILLHGIVRYYSLDAKSMNSRGRGHRSQKIVQVRNNLYEDFQPPHVSLLKFVTRPISASIN
ncbi:R3H domain [Cinara cedri]|uniref:R3H domain n=1 Tax=Cinara cedri TaxID=506608 RepID=A0A5E4M9C2_9HEMI|nr:R3H domain [Cinara cedri]